MWLSRMFAPIALVLSTLLSIGLVSQASQARVPEQGDIPANRFWEFLAEPVLAATPPTDQPVRYRALQAATAQIAAVLDTAPLEASPEAWKQAVRLDLPQPDGNFAAFALVESPVMEPALAARYPTITTYLGQGIDDPFSLVRLTRSPQGYYAQILDRTGRQSYIAPYGAAAPDVHIAFADQDLQPSAPFTEPEVEAADAAATPAQSGSNGGMRREYRLAIATTGEYGLFHGETTAQVMTAVVDLVNALNLTYEREAATRFLLVNGTDQLFFRDPATDPFTDNLPNQEERDIWLDESNAVIENTLGRTYDIGHLLTNGGGGVASSLSCSGASQNRGRANSGAGQPTTANLIGTFIHEVGHQLGSAHTFNSLSANCGNLLGRVQRSGTSAYEPGSGSTIMGYAGICAPENVANTRDFYFHAYSLERITTYPRTGNALGCGGTDVPTGNTPPTVDAGASYTIPARTPFELIGSADDPDGDTLSFTWEQYDLGAASPPADDDGTRPLFRSLPPSSSPQQLFPQLSAIISGQEPIGAVLPKTNRTLTFRFTARDNRPGAGAFAFDSTSLTVVAAAGPFRVTAPLGGERLQPNAAMTVAWDVANTNLAPINCAAVQIAFSSDGGQSFPLILAASTPNDGSEQVNLPDQGVVAANIRVKCTNNIFLNMSPRFTIIGGVSKFNDTNDGACDSDCSLREAITVVNAATGPDTLVLEPGVYRLDLANAEVMQINESLTLVGAGADQTIIDAGGVRQIFAIAPNATVRMEGITLRGGNTTGNGGAVANSGMLELVDAVLSDNQGASGGAIYNNGDLTLQNVVLHDNRAVGSGSGNQVANVDYYGSGNGGAVANNGTLHLIDTTIRNNSAGRNGGGIASGGSISLVRSEITENSAQGASVYGGGGGMWLLNAEQAELTQSVIRANQATENGSIDGAGIAVYQDSRATLTTTLTISASALIGNRGGTFGSGGGLYLDGRQIMAQALNSTFSGNQGSDGGAIWMFGGDGHHLRLDFVTISANSSASGAVYIRRSLVDPGGSFTMNNSIVSGNTRLDCIVGIAAQGQFNLVSDATQCGIPIETNLIVSDPLLAALADNGGATWTHQPYEGSPALDAADPAACPAVDQRGSPRPVGSGCEIGAFEGEPAPLIRMYLPALAK